MICSNIKLTGPAESIGIDALAIHEWNQRDSTMDVQRKLEILADANLVRGIRAARSDSDEAIHASASGDMDCFARRNDEERHAFHHPHSETDFDGWRKAARALALNVQPSDVTWRVADDAPNCSSHGALSRHGTFNVPAKFVELARSRSCTATRTVRTALSPAVAAAQTTICLISRPIPMWRSRCDGQGRAPRQHKMHAFVRFREVGREQNRISSPGSSRSTTSSNWPRRSSRAVSPTCPGRS